MKKRMIICLLAVTTVVTIVLFMTVSDGQGKRFFESDQFHYQTIRTMGHAVYHGAAPAEVLAVVSRIEDGATESWHRNWLSMAHYCQQLAEKSGDNVSAGNALLRASNYFRASEFFMPTSDPARGDFYDKSVRSFQKGLSKLGISFSEWKIPYDGAQMRVYYFPGRAGLPLILTCNGFDGTNEESFFFVGAPMIQRGYPVIMFEGPGQSSMIREHGIRFTPDWHVPLSAVITHAENRAPELRGRKRVLIGISLGGLLAGRAAAYETRLDGTVIWGAPFDSGEVARNTMPAIGRWLYSKGFRETFNLIARIKHGLDYGFRWKMDNGLWTMGGDSPFDFIEVISRYTLRDVADRIKCHTLILSGTDDIFSSMDQNIKSEFKNARTVSYHEFNRASGASSHCQSGAVEQAVQVITLWIKNTGMQQATK